MERQLYCDCKRDFPDSLRRRINLKDVNAEAGGNRKDVHLPGETPAETAFFIAPPFKNSNFFVVLVARQKMKIRFYVSSPAPFAYTNPGCPFVFLSIRKGTRSSALHFVDMSTGYLVANI
ncbi:hypothetical protein AB6A40_011179 [Gnathostoma spinigerum]|uniref:Uncharacterized protein n=1 Tax=Gnathostoma spinigerum TaxID=75299 RepID=A0ABD6EWZ9_9BILA